MDNKKIEKLTQVLQRLKSARRNRSYKKRGNRHCFKYKPY